MLNPDKFDELILAGAVEPVGLDEQGDFLYRFTETLQDIDPEMARQVNDMFYREIAYLWQEGFLEIDMSSSTPTVSLNEKSFDAQSIRRLPKDLQDMLLMIVNSLRIE